MDPDDPRLHTDWPPSFNDAEAGPSNWAGTSAGSHPVTAGADEAAVHAPALTEVRSQGEERPRFSSRSQTNTSRRSVRVSAAEDEEDVDRVCRICRCGPEPGQPLFYPCKCTGSIRYCHADCLKEWLAHSKKSRCELCNHAFTFHKIYAPNMPSRLPAYLQVAFLSRKAAAWSLYGLRCALVATMWLAVVPYFNVNIFHSFFWICDALLWASGAGTASWSGVLINVTSQAGAIISGSEQAAPSPVPSPPVAPEDNLSLSIATASFDLLRLASDGLARSARLLAWFAQVLRPSRLAALLAHFITEPLATGNRLLALHRDFTRNLLNHDWAAPLGQISHDIFVGQVLTCVLVVAVLSAWFTREWVLMHLPAQAPDLEEEVDLMGGLGNDRPERGAAQRMLRQQREEIRLLDNPEGELERHEEELHGLLDTARANRQRRQTAPDSNQEQLESNSEDARVLGGDDPWDAESVWTLRNPSANGVLPPASPIETDAQVDPRDAHEGKGKAIDEGTNDAVPPEADESVRKGRYDQYDYTENILVSEDSQPSSAKDSGKEHIAAGRADDSDSDSRWTEHSEASDGREEDEFFGPPDPVREALLRRRLHQQQQEGARLGNRAEPNGLLPGPDEAEIRAALAQALEGNFPPNVDPQNGVAGEEAVVRDALAVEEDLDLDDANWQEMQGELEGLLAAIGFQGDPLHFLANVSIVVCFCTFLLLFFVGAPYLIGRILGAGAGLLDIIMAPVRLVRIVTDPFFDWAIGASASAAKRVVALHSVGSLTRPESGHPSRFFSEPSLSWAARQWQIGQEAVSRMCHALSAAVASNVTAPVTPQPFGSTWSHFLATAHGFPMSFLTTVVEPLELKILRATENSDKLAAILVGHMWLFCALALRMAFGEESKTKASEGEAETPVIKEIVTQTLLVLKVVRLTGSVIFTTRQEIIIFPIGCGIVLDLCTMCLFGATLPKRFDRLIARPFTWVFIRWASGTLFMARFGGYVSHVRMILRPGVLSWIRDPEDPDFQPLKEILDRKSSSQLRKIGASAVMYGSLIVALFGVSSAVLWLLNTRACILPLRLTSTTSSGSVSGLDLPAIALVLPHLVSILDPEKWLENLSKRWWRCMTFHLRLSYFFFGTAARSSSEDSDPTLSQKDIPSTLSSKEIDAWEAEESRIDQATASNEDGSFFARVPASDNSVLGSPLLIHINSSGVPVTDRGKEALRVQEEKMEKMNEPKARYEIMRLPPGFGNRVRLLLVLLWLSVTTGLLFSVAAPILLGRVLLGAQHGSEIHDAYTWSAGAICFLPIILTMHKLSTYHIVHKLLDRRALGGLGNLSDASSTSELQSRRQLRRRWHLRRLTRLVRKSLGATWMLIAFGFVTPTLLGIAFDQLFSAQLRFKPNEKAQSALPYAWAMGQLLQELYVQLLPWLSANRFNTAIKDARRRALRRPHLWQSTREIFLPVATASVVAIMAPSALATTVQAFSAVRSPSGLQEQSAIQILLSFVQHLYRPLAASTPEAPKAAADLLWRCRLSICALIAGGFAGASLVGKLSVYEGELRDEVYLRASELLNYEGENSGKGATGKQLTSNP